MMQVAQRNKTQSVCSSEGQIYNPLTDQDSVTTLKYNQSQDSNNKSMKLYQKQKEKNQSALTEAAIRMLLHSDRFISNEKAYFKFPKMDFYLNIDCLFTSINNKKSIEASNISVINEFKKIKYSEISKKTNAVHIYMQNRDAYQMPWQCLVDKMQSFGNDGINTISNQIVNFFGEFSKSEDSESSCDQSIDLMTASKIFNECQSRKEIEQIDELFLLNKNKPMLAWRGVNKEFVSVHINECYLNMLQYTPEEFQMEVALSGIPDFVTSHNYNIWVESILTMLTNMFSREGLQTSQNERFQKEFVTQFGQNTLVDFESYPLIIGNSDLIVEVGIEEVKLLKKKNKRKAEIAAPQTAITETVQTEKNNTCLKINEEKRKLSDEEKYFINNHYFKIQDFDFNKSKVCKYRILNSDFRNRIQFQLYA